MNRDRNKKTHDNWATPKELYNKLDQEFDFDFDPCPLCYGEILPERDGLLIEWGQRNFVNPPYSRKLKEAFILRAVEFKKKGRLSVLLIPVSTSTAIFHDVIKPNATEIRFVRGRVKFEQKNEYGIIGKKHSAMSDSMLVIFDGRIKGKYYQPGW